MSSKIKWPAIIKYSGDDELAYVPSQSVWNSDTNLNDYAYKGGDQLVDSAGVVYDLASKNEFCDIPPVGELNLEALTELVRLHASSLGNCCIAKLVFPSVSSAIQSVEHIKDEH